MVMENPEHSLVIFSVKGKPVGKARPRVVTVNGRAMAYTPQATADYEALVQAEYLRQCGGAYFHRHVPLTVRIVAHMPIPKSINKAQREKMLRGAVPCTKKPDWDNIGKIVCDALNGVAWNDDAQIIQATVIKQYAADDHVGVQVVISEARHEEVRV